MMKASNRLYFMAGGMRRRAPLRMSMRGKKIVVMPGEKHGQLVAVAFSHKNENGYYWKFNCEACGGFKAIRAADVLSGKQKTCGCSHVTHGATRGPKHTPEYMTWCSMLARCENPNATGYENYGGRGVRICERWHDFTNFRADMGPRPEGTSLDRVDNDGHYEPGNCRWATREEQSRDAHGGR